MNPFNCDCHLAWFHKLVLDHIATMGKDILKEMSCTSPNNMAGRNFLISRHPNFAVQPPAVQLAFVGM